MSVNNFEGSKENLFSFEPSQAGIETNNVLIFEEISKKLEACLAIEKNHKESMDGVFDFLVSIFDSVQEEFDELISLDNNKKRFLKALPRIFALLLNTKVDITEKIKILLKIAMDANTLIIWKKPR